MRGMRSYIPKGNERVCHTCNDEIIGKSIVVLDCGHNFHVRCIFNFLSAIKFECPNCRGSTATMYDIGDNPDITEDLFNITRKAYLNSPYHNISNNNNNNTTEKEKPLTLINQMPQKPVGIGLFKYISEVIYSSSEKEVSRRTSDLLRLIDTKTDVSIIVDSGFLLEDLRQAGLKIPEWTMRGYDFKSIFLFKDISWINLLSLGFNQKILRQNRYRCKIITLLLRHTNVRLIDLTRAGITIADILGCVPTHLELNELGCDSYTLANWSKSEGIELPHDDCVKMNHPKATNYGQFLAN